MTIDTTGDEYGSTGNTSVPQSPSGNGTYRQPTKEELADVKQWLSTIAKARKFDKHARSNYGLDRKYLRGARGAFTVEVPIAPAYVDVLQSFIFAKNPSVNVGPSAMTEPPPMKEVVSMVIDSVQQNRQQQAQTMNSSAQQAQQLTAHLDPAQVANLANKGKMALQQQGAGQPGGPMAPPPPDPSGQPNAPIQAPPVSEDDPEVMAGVQAMMGPYQKKRDDAKQFGSTLEIAISKSWEQAKLKARGKQQVKSGLSVGIGWIKAFWMERTQKDPVKLAEIQDVQAQLQRLAATQKALADGESTNEDADRASLQQQLAALQANSDIVVARGFVVDFIAPEDIQVSTEVPSLADYNDAAWIAQRSFLTVDAAKSEYPDIAGYIDQASMYYPQKQRNVTEDDTGWIARSVGDESSDTAREADYYTKGAEGNTADTQSVQMLCRWEVWDRNTNNVITLIEGIQCYAKAPYVPDHSTTRGHPFFGYGIGYINGSRHPRSMITRSASLFDEYNSVRTNYREARRRSIPKTAYNRSNLDKQDVDKIASGTVGEMIGIEPIDPSTPMTNLLAPIAYNQIDMALYDTSVIRAELEQIWGVQEALSSSIRTPKTATESQIQQQGTNSRIGYMTDDLDEMYSELAQYTGEVLLQELTEEDIQDIAGPYALWPQGISIQDMNALLTVQVDAGSSGKPKTAEQQQSWAALLPLFQKSIEQIGAMRKSTPDEMADCLESLLEESARRLGETGDITQYLPDPPRTQPPAPIPPPQQPLDESAISGPQLVAMASVLADCRAGVISADSALAVLQIAFPNAPQELMQHAVNGATPKPGDPATQIDSANAKTAPPPDLTPGKTGDMPGQVVAPSPGATATTGAPV